MTLPSLLLALSFLPFFEARNTAANYIINPPADGEKISVERPNLTVREVCPACEGKGEIVLKETNFGQANGLIGGVGKTVRKKCAVCGGDRRLSAFVNPTELALQVARDRETFASEHQAKGHIPVGQAFVSREDYEALSKDQRKLVEEAYGRPCTSCHWTGLETCRKCGGRGVLSCPNDDCKGGWAVTKTTTSYTRSSSGGSSRSRGSYSSSGGSRRVSRKEEKVNVYVCEDCGGARLILCPDCQGHRAKPCRRCNGLGQKQKGYGL